MDRVGDVEPEPFHLLEAERPGVVLLEASRRVASEPDGVVPDLV